MNPTRHSELLGNRGNKVSPISVRGFLLSNHGQVRRSMAEFCNTPAPFHRPKVTARGTAVGFRSTPVSRRGTKVPCRHTPAAWPDIPAAIRRTKVGFRDTPVDGPRTPVAFRGTKVNIPNTPVRPNSTRFPIKRIILPVIATPNAGQPSPVLSDTLSHRMGWCEGFISNPQLATNN